MITWTRKQLWIHKNRLAWWQRRRPFKSRHAKMYVGLPGSGKSLVMVAEAQEQMRKGVQVYSNIEIWDPEFGEKAGTVGSWLDVFTVAVRHIEQGEGCFFAIDEVHNWSDSRSWHGAATWWLHFITQLRKLGIGLAMTSQQFSQVDKRIRGICEYVVSCRMPFGPLPLVRTREYDPTLTEDSDKYIAGEIGKAWIDRIPWHVYAGYNSYNIVHSMDWEDLSDEDSASLSADLYQRATIATDRLSRRISFVPFPSLDDFHDPDDSQPFLISSPDIGEKVYSVSAT